MAVIKLPFLFLTLYFVTFNVNSSGKVLNHGNRIARLPLSSISAKPTFVGLNRNKPKESNPTTTLTEANSYNNVVLSKFFDKRNRNLVLVTGGSLVFAVTVYKFVSKLVRYYLYDRYVTTNYPGVVNTLGHVLLKNTRYSPNDLFMNKVVKPLSKTFEKMPYFKGFVRPGLRRVSTSSLVDKDTYVLLFFYNSHEFLELKKYGVDVLDYTRNAYESLKRSGKKVEMVAVDLNKSNDKSFDVFKGMPWYSVPFEDLRRKRWLVDKFDVMYGSQMVLLDSEGNVLNDRCMNMLYERVNDFPWTNMKLQDLFPDYLYDSENSPVPKSRLEGKLVGLYLDGGNPELNAKMKKKVSEFYEYMNQETGGNFEVVVLNSSLDTKSAEESLKTNHPSWLSVRHNDTSGSKRFLAYPGLLEYCNLNSLNRFVLLDQEGNVYASNVGYFLDEKLYKDLYEEYSKGANRVKGDKMAHLHLLNTPLLVVLADREDPKSLEKLEEEMNLAFAKHRHKRKMTLVQFMLVKDKNVADLFKKAYHVKKERMVLASKFSKPLLYDGEVNEKSMLELLDRYYKQGLNK